MSTVTIKRFVRTFEGGRSHYSIRRRVDGLFQLYHDDPHLGINQPYQFEDKPISGLFSDIEAAQSEGGFKFEAQRFCGSRIRS